MTFSMIREIVSLDTLAPNTSAKWASISPVVRPFALSDSTISSTPVNRLFSFFTICGSNVEPVSCGTSISTDPISVSTVFVRVPLREFPLPPAHVVLFVSEMLVHLRFQSGFKDVSRQPVQQPARPHELDALLPGLGQSSCANSC
jgi:hypothetical protein